MAGRFKRAWSALTGPDAKPAPAPRVNRRLRAYASAGMGVTANWQPGSRDPNSEMVNRNSLALTRERSRDLYHSSAWHRRVVEALANAIVSTGLRPTVNTGDTMTRHPLTGKMVRLDALVYECWEKWSRHPVPGSSGTMASLDQMAARTWLIDGEFLARFRARRKEDMPGLPPIMIEPMDATQLPVQKIEMVGNGLNRIIAGVEVDALGEKVAFHVLPEPPGSLFPFGAGVWDTQRIEASKIIHLFRQEHPGQMRGISLTAPVLKSIYLHDQFHEAIQVGAAVANDIAIIVNRKEADSGGMADGAPLPPSQARDAAGNPEIDDEGRPIHEMGPGMVYQGNPDETIAVQQPQAPSNVSDYVRAILKEVAAGVGLSYYTLTGDMSDSSFAQAKLGLLEQGVAVACLREQSYLPGYKRPLWRAWIDAGIVNGIFPNDLRLYDEEWSKPKTNSADALQEAKANLLRLQMCETNLTEIIESSGRDPDKVLEQYAKDMALLKKHGAVPLWDLKQVTASGQAQAIVNEPDPNAPQKP